jgi:asparagine synthase (glutamine-hydrolysing)
MESVYISDGNVDIMGAAELYANRLAREIAPIRLTGNYGSEILRGIGAFRPVKRKPSFLMRDFDSYVDRAIHRYSQIRMANRLSFAAFRQAPWFNYSRLTLEQSQLRVRTPFMDNDVVALMYQAPRQFITGNTLSCRLVRDFAPLLATVPTDRGEYLDEDRLVPGVKMRVRALLKRAELGFDYCMPQRLMGIDRLLSPLAPERLFLGRFSFLHTRIWLRRELSGYVQDVLLDPKSLSRDIVDGRAMHAAVRAHISGQRNYTRDILRLLTYEVTVRVFQEQTSISTGQM